MAFRPLIFRFLAEVIIKGGSVNQVGDGPLAINFADFAASKTEVTPGDCFVDHRGKIKRDFLAGALRQPATANLATREAGFIQQEH